ncbi:MAG: 50S ribosomal protein L9 [Zetaproteobacteria bacterium]|nr:MAG: 50S ribosomal protein L9 [Zetaproteobacteria bacterium]
MQLILLERVEGLGNVGDEVTVRPGYGRNYLIPQGKATLATEANRKLFERRKAQLLAKQQQELEQAQGVAERLAALELSLYRATSDGKHLYGSVSTAELADLVNAQGFNIARRNILIDEPIKTVGEHSFRIRLHPDVTATLSVKVESENH